MKLKMYIVACIAFCCGIIVMQGVGYTEEREQNNLYQKIQEEAGKRKKEMQNAVIDPTWKAVPGINGIEVDVQKSYDKLKKKGQFDENALIYKEIRPTIHLRDLPPTPMYKGNSEKKMVAFTINVALGWKDLSIVPILQTLKKHKVHATFFVEGQWAAENTTILKEMIADGHEIGNHSYRHPDMQRVGLERIQQELSKTNAVVENATNQKVTWFAPPSGSFSETAVREAFRQGMWTVMWTVDTVDWKRPPASIIVQRVANKVHGGAIILMHPTKPTSEAMESLILLMKSKGLKMGTLSELVDERRIS